MPNPVIKALILEKSHESDWNFLSGILLRLLPGTVAVYERVGLIMFQYSSYVNSDDKLRDWHHRL
jgi:hypothetical protein